MFSLLKASCREGNHFPKHTFCLKPYHYITSLISRFPRNSTNDPTCYGSTGVVEHKSSRQELRFWRWKYGQEKRTPIRHGTWLESTCLLEGRYPRTGEYFFQAGLENNPHILKKADKMGHNEQNSCWECLPWREYRLKHIFSDYSHSTQSSTNVSYLNFTLHALVWSKPFLNFLVYR